MRRAAGMPASATDATTTIKARREERGERELIALAARVVDSPIRTIRLADLADHPDNVRDEPGDVADLMANIKALGLLQHPVVASRDAFLGAYPEYASQIGSRNYVILVGHRRRLACQQLGWTELDARVADELIDADATDVETMIAENILRRALSPIEEARALQRLLERRGGDQRAVAQRFGMSQPWISKRLKLLDLAPELQAGVARPANAADEGPARLSVTDALIYAGLEDPEEQRGAWALAQRQGLKAEAAVTQQRAESRRHAGETQARKRAADEGLPFEAAVAAERLLFEEPDVDAARQGGHLVVTADERGVFAYAAAADSPTASRRPAPRPRHADQSGDRQQARQATAARASACKRIAARKPSTADATRHMAICIAGRNTAFFEALRLAHGWLIASNIGPDERDPEAYRAAVLAGREETTVLQLAWAMALAYDELRAREDRPWDTRDAAHLDRLAHEASYDPTSWEQARLAVARTSTSPSADPPAPASPAGVTSSTSGSKR
jgi:ParB family chromosome partitioning protein